MALEKKVKKSVHWNSIVEGGVGIGPRLLSLPHALCQAQFDWLINVHFLFISQQTLSHLFNVLVILIIITAAAVDDSCTLVGN